MIGASGELGYQIIKNSAGWEKYATYHTNIREFNDVVSYKLDITNKNNVDEIVSEIKPDVVINCAVSDRSINGLSEEQRRVAILGGALNIAHACGEISCRSIYLSTDLVFDGKKGNYSEADIPNPVLPYGGDKAEMGRELLALDSDVAIVRTSLIITTDPMGHQVSWIVNSIRNNISLNLFTDEYRSPVSGENLAKAILELSDRDYRGLINISGPEALNRYELGCAIASRFKLDTDLLNPVKAEELAVKRPLSCTLDSSKARALFSIEKCI